MKNSERLFMSATLGLIPTAILFLLAFLIGTIPSEDKLPMIACFASWPILSARIWISAPEIKKWFDKSDDTCQLP